MGEAHVALNLFVDREWNWASVTPMGAMPLVELCGYRRDPCFLVPL